MEHVDVEVDGRREHPQARRCRSPPRPRGAPRGRGCRRRRRGRRAAATAAPWRGTAAARGGCVGSITAAEPVRWPSRHDRWSASGWASMKARICARLASWLASPGRAASDRGAGGGQVVGPVEVGRVAQHGQAGFDRWSEPGVHQRHGSSVPTDSPIRVLTAGTSGGGDAVVDDRDASIGGDEVGAVEGAVEPEGLAQAGRARQQVTVAPGRRAQGSHLVDAGHRLGRPQQHGDALAVAAAHRVGAPVHAVGEVHVQPPRRAEHRGVALRHATVGVAAGVLGAAVRLHLHDAGRPLAAHEQLARAARARPPADRARRSGGPAADAPSGRGGPELVGHAAPSRWCR